MFRCVSYLSFFSVDCSICRCLSSTSLAKSAFRALASVKSCLSFSVAQTCCSREDLKHQRSYLSSCHQLLWFNLYLLTTHFGFHCCVNLYTLMYVKVSKKVTINLIDRTNVKNFSVLNKAIWLNPGKMMLTNIYETRVYSLTNVYITLLYMYQ